MENRAVLPSVDPAKLMSVSLDLKQLAEALLPPALARPVDAAFVRQIIRGRRERDRHFERDLFADPAWDMMLDLYAAGLECRNVSVSSLCTAAAVPPTTALRWISLLTAKGLLTRKADPVDTRRVLVELSDDATERMNAYFAVVQRRGDLAV